LKGIAMGTLYDVLGLSRQANGAQIEHAYRTATENLVGGDGQSEQDMIRAKAIKEAHAILMSPTRRVAYNEQLRLKDLPTYHVVEQTGTRWLPIAVMVLGLIAFIGYWVHHSKQLELERVALETAQMQHAADAAALLADAEEARLERVRLDDNRQADATRARGSAQARYEGERIHYELQAAQTEAEHKKEMAPRRAKAEQANEERTALMLNRQREMDMRRALAIPIVRH
jgi:curved DNA-binding protein CbpA